jgi:two-component system CheB/CheR fusion protein
VSDGEDIESPTEEAVADASFSRLLDKLSKQYAFDFREYKQTSLARRIKIRMQQVRMENYDRYSEYLDLHPDEHVALFNTILINITAFFRDPDAWKILGAEVIPRLVDQASESRSLRLWSVGCSSGEEAYSIAILLAEQLGPRARDFTVKIYATDVDDEALGAGRHGLYRVEDVKEVPTTILERYFAREGQTYRFRRDLRRWVIFGRHNIVRDPPLSHIDLLICRNVLIYFTSDLQEKILARFHYAIREGGSLCLGRSESLLARSRWFSPVNLKWRIFQRTTAPAPTVAAALLREGHNAVSSGATAGRTEPGEQMNRLMRVIEALPFAVMMIDATDNVLVWNAAAETFYDIPGDGALNRKFRDLDISYRIEGLRARVEEVKSKHIPARLENVVFTRRSGETVHADIIIIPILEAHRIAAVMVSAADATEHARLKEQMSRISEQHATAIEELQSTNEELETTNEELQSTNEELETTNEELQSTNEELETTVEELQAANSELATLNLELERRSSELKRLDDHQRKVLSSLDDAVVVLDREGIVTTWNQTAARMWGLTAENVVGRPYLSLPIGEMPRMAREAIRRVLERGETHAVRDVPYVVPSGENHRTTLRLSPLRNSDGEITGVVGLAASEAGAS